MIFSSKNLPRWERAAQGQGEMTAAELAKELLEFKRRLWEHCSLG
jgi:hypothetical protein